MHDLTWQYLRMYPVKDIAWKDIQTTLQKHENSDAEWFQKKLLDCTVRHPIALKYPVSLGYSQLFLKTLLSKIEECSEEVLEDVYFAYTDILSREMSPSCGDNFCYRTYYFSESLIITLKETSNLVCDGTTGMCTWEASHVLAEWCCKEAHRFQDKNVLELGAGLGLLGLAVVQSCKPSSYTFTDLHPSVLNTLTENVQINLNKVPHDKQSAPNKDIWVDEITMKYNNTDAQIRRLDWESDSFDDQLDVILAAASKRVVTQSETHHHHQASPSQPQLSVNILHLTL
ncbi:lysine N-methyltransferase EEF2KMT-like 2 [Homarus americanus]|uniref:Lysine N-methyltransferase EEF2KMT-like 2 n=1 Tax=Homarus americanus TaxID=6706 RepID=A0A8J5MKB0_HOMAM|nr:lysine N-methyltransferase EEF2KMT-like 2 [Homarus americanus]